MGTKLNDARTDWFGDWKSGSCKAKDHGWYNVMSEKHGAGMVSCYLN